MRDHAHHWGRKNIGLFLPIFILLALSCFFTANSSAWAQNSSALTLVQVEKLIEAGAPDSAIAHEIQTRGIAFDVTTDILANLQALNAGPETLTKLRSMPPPLNVAKSQIPAVLKTIYAALNEGDVSTIRPNLSDRIAGNAQILDSICKPYAYRAHYISAILERPQGLYEARVHALFTPLNEVAYVLTFRYADGRFVLTDVQDAPPDWTNPDIETASALARKLLFAMNASKNEVVSQIVDSAFDFSRLPDMSLRKNVNDPPRVIGGVKPANPPRLVQDDGIKISLDMYFWCEGNQDYFPEYEITFLFDPSMEPMRMVGWSWTNQFNKTWTKSPNIEEATLRRFGLAVPPRSVENFGGNVSPVAPSTGARAESMRYFKTGVDAFTAGNWISAAENFQAATVKDPTNGDAWVWWGRASLAAGNTSIFPAAWDKAINLGFPLMIDVCHEKGFMAGRCERGYLKVSSTRIAFDKRGQQRGDPPLFSVPPNQIIAKGVIRSAVTNMQGFTATYMRVSDGTKNYNLYVAPLGIDCDTTGVQLLCPAYGVTQQTLIGNYVLDAISRIASGSLGKKN